MGSPDSEWGRGAISEDRHEVTLTHAFEIHQTEVTQALWTSLGLPNPSTEKPYGKDCKAPDCPVGNVNWFEAVHFANLLSAAHSPALQACYTLDQCSKQAAQGLECVQVTVNAPTLYDCEGYRLPTDAEWEYVARAGTTTSFYSGCIAKRNNPVDCFAEPALESAAWYCNNSLQSSHPVATKQPNAWGLYDVLGNANEWVNDFANGTSSTLPETDPGGILVITKVTSGRISRGWGFTALLRLLDAHAAWESARTLAMLAWVFGLRARYSLHRQRGEEQLPEISGSRASASGRPCSTRFTAPLAQFLRPRRQTSH